MAVQRRRVEALHVVEGDGRVNHEPEQPGPDHVPEGDGDEEVDRPLVLLHPRRQSATAAGLPSHRTRRRTSGTTSRALNTDPQARATVRRAGEVQVVAGADDAARQEDRGRQQGRRRRHAGPHEAQPHEEEGDDRGGEDLEEPFDPQVDHPPPPVFDHRQVRVLAPGQARPVEQGDGGASPRPAAPPVASARPASAGPGAAPGPSGTARAAGRRTGRSATPAPGRRTRTPGGRSRTTPRPTACCGRSTTRPVSEPTTTTSSARNRTLTPRRCPFGSCSLTSGPMNKPGRQPRRRNPEQAHLDVPRPGHAVRQPLRRAGCRRTRPPRRRSGPSRRPATSARESGRTRPRSI